MPTYSFRCPKCNHEWVEFMWVSEKDLAKCPQCDTKAEDNYGAKTQSNVLIQGKGFYQERTVR